MSLTREAEPELALALDGRTVHRVAHRAAPDPHHLPAAVPAGRGQHAEGVPGGVLDQDRYKLPGRVRLEPAMRVVDDAGHHDGVHGREPRGQSLRDMINGDALGVG